MLRPMTYAGTWYPAEKKDISKYLAPVKEEDETIAAVCPHAGWIYSGKTAGKVFARIKPPALYILIGPNHRGAGAPVSVYPEGSWQTPLGPLEVDEKTAASIIAGSGYAEADFMAHMPEHSIEVQTPFIKLTSPSAKIVPICMHDYGADTCRDLGIAVSKAVPSGIGSTVVLASSDMSHYVTASAAKNADILAIEKILALDPDGLLKVVARNAISMCGAGPVAAALWAAIEMGATRAELVDYTNSGEVTGDETEVVGYAGLVIY